jgi:hypothetical protein
MKYFQAISILSALAGLTSAAPAAESRQFKAVITFSGAAASYTLNVPTDATPFQTSKYKVGKAVRNEPCLHLGSS